MAGDLQAPYGSARLSWCPEVASHLGIFPAKSRSVRQNLAVITDAEAESRKPVWTAFSEFWLDTELTDSDLQWIAAVAAASGYTVSELRDIYLYEVAPVVGANLLVVAGEWAGFDEKWLHAEARKRAEHRSL